MDVLKFQMQIFFNLDHKQIFFLINQLNDHFLYLKIFLTLEILVFQAFLNLIFMILNFSFLLM